MVHENSYRLSDEHWQKIYGYLLTHKGVYVKQDQATRNFVEAILWMTRSGAQWRLLPPCYGKWNTIYRRFSDWSKRKIWEGLFKYCADDPDLEYVMMDSTTVRSHACSCGYKKGIHNHWVEVAAD